MTTAGTGDPGVPRGARRGAPGARDDRASLVGVDGALRARDVSRPGDRPQPPPVTLPRPADGGADTVSDDTGSGDDGDGDAASGLERGS